MNRRNRYDIITDILLILNEPVGKTRIMYQANLSHNQLQLFLGQLERSGLVEKTPGDKWVLTENGRKFEVLSLTHRKIGMELDRVIDDSGDRRTVPGISS